MLIIKGKEIRSWTKREQEKEIKKMWRCVVGLRGLLRWAVWTQSWSLPSFRVQQKIKRKIQPLLSSSKYFHLVIAVKLVLKVQI